ncbi:hypothetical protein lerEdw1_009976 [Lerista edwardsae]|nr:hypothetical protein lerEdw1_009976 [Lerista edwardsae]
MSIDRDTLSMPCIRAIPRGLYDGLELRLEGFIPQQSKGFTIDFCYGQFVGANISLRFHLSFDGPPASSLAVVTLNSRERRQWGKEEKTHSTLRQGQNFKLRFTITSTGYKVVRGTSPQ